MNKYLASLLATFSLSLAELSTAQSITIGPASTEIPTTGAPVLITLAALLAYLAYHFKNHSGARKLGVFLLLGAGLSALGGIKLLQQATAGGGANLDLKTIADSYYYHSWEVNEYHNNTGITLEVLRVDDGGSRCSPPFKAVTNAGPACNVGQRIPHQGRCSIDCTD